jgi:hypothetical protein
LRNRSSSLWEEFTMPKTILVLSANPKSTDPLRLEREVRDIEEALQRARERDNYVVKKEGALRADDFRRAMLDHRPEIVHFSGHGTGDEGIVLEDDSGAAKLVSTAALQDFFRSFAKIAAVECVVLNACYSAVQAEAIASTVKYVVGMNQAVGDDAAYDFAVGFYDGLGAGEPVDIAYELGCNAIQLEGSDEYTTPILIVNGQQQIRKKSPKSSEPASAKAGTAQNRAPETETKRGFTADVEDQTRQATLPIPAESTTAQTRTVTPGLKHSSLVYSLLLVVISATISAFALRDFMYGICTGALFVAAYQVMALVVTYAYSRRGSNNENSPPTPRTWQRYLPLVLGALLAFFYFMLYLFPATPEERAQAAGILLVAIGVVVWQIIQLTRDRLRKAHSSS